jgi:3-dehydroquinate synthase
MVVGVTQNLSNLVINSSFGTYTITFQPLDIEEYENSYFLVDQVLEGMSGLNRNKCVFISAREENKTLRSVEDAVLQLSEKGMTKKNDLVVIGGGCLQDIGTLVASLYMRGVKWNYVPTTLAAMGDSCIGGKSSINAGGVKNLIGNFYPPRTVLIDPSFVSTLPNLEVVAGISEIIKICFARSFDSFTESTRLISYWRMHRDVNSLSQVIQLSLRCKQHFIEKDEFDTGIRKLLNFGHSFGHALEAASNYRIPHGVAILIGMVAASKHPQSTPSVETKLLIENCLLFCRLIENEVAAEISNVDYVVFSQALKRDKKNSSSNLVLVLPIYSGLKVIEFPLEDNAIEAATNAMRSAIKMVLNEVC